jgi:hypothetical protein
MPYDLANKRITVDEFIPLLVQASRDYGFRSALRLYWWNMAGSGARVFGVPVFGLRDEEEKWFYNAVVLPVYRVSSAVNRVIWGFRYRFIPYHRYNVVYTDLPPGYYDIDTVMLHANFQLLRRYVEDEHGGADKLKEYTDYCAENGDHHHAEREEEALRLYNWWTQERLEDEKRLNELQKMIYARPLEFKDSDDPEMAAEGFKELVEPVWTPHEERMKEQMRLLRQKIESDEENNLIQLMKIRKSLWT